MRALVDRLSAAVSRVTIWLGALLGIMPRWLRVATQFAANLISLAVIGVIAWALIDMAVRQTINGELVEPGHVDILVWPARWIAVAGAVGMILVLFAQLARPARAAETASGLGGLRAEDAGL